MQVVYKSRDGKYFGSAIECEKYEQAYCNSFLMFDREGKETSDPDKASILYIKFQNVEDGLYYQPGAQAFIDLCLNNDVSYDGIERGSFGIYVWDEYNDSYIYIDQDIVQALQKLDTKIFDKN